MGQVRAFPVVLLTLVLTACGSSSKPAGSASTPSAEIPESPTLADARRHRDAATQLEPPRMPVDKSPPAVVAFMKESITPWVKARRKTVIEAVDAFRRAATELQPPDRAVPLLEASQTVLSFVEAYDTLSHDVAAAIATDDTLKELLGVFRESESPLIEMARGLLQECVTGSGSEDSPSETGQECRRLLSKLP